MKILSYILTVLMTCMMISELQAQRILLVEKTGRFKNYKYFVGDEVHLKVAPEGEKVSGDIYSMTDSSILLSAGPEIQLKDIQKVLKPRWGYPLLTQAFRIAAIGYVALEATNNIINNEATIVHKSTIITSVGLVGASYALIPLHYKRMKLEKKWKIKILNLSWDEEPPNPSVQ